MTSPPPPMSIAYWLFLLLALVIGGELALVWLGDLTANDARDLFLFMGLPILILFGLVIGVVLRGHVHEANKRL